MKRGRPREGSIRRVADGRFEVCVTFTDAKGKRKYLRRLAENKSAALRLRDELRSLAAQAEKIEAAPTRPLTVRDLVAHFRHHHCQPAEYHAGRKIAGRRSMTGLGAYLAAIEGFFGVQELATVTHADCAAFKVARLKTPKVRGGGPRTIATVNRELGLLRRAFNVAIQQGWLTENPFRRGELLICASEEFRRERVLSRAEECRLLDACTGARAHIRPVVVALLDTGCRKSELTKATWGQVDLETRTISVESYKGGRRTVRTVGMTNRLHDILLELARERDAADLIFPVGDFKRAWASACQAAGIKNLRLHDLRHTAATRLADALPLAQVGNILGHTQPATTMRYVNAGDEIRARAVAALNAFNAETEAEEEPGGLPS